IRRSLFSAVLTSARSSFCPFGAVRSDRWVNHDFAATGIPRLLRAGASSIQTGNGRKELLAAVRVYHDLPKPRTCVASTRGTKPSGVMHSFYMCIWSAFTPDMARFHTGGTTPSHHPGTSALDSTSHSP